MFDMDIYFVFMKLEVHKLCHSLLFTVANLVSCAVTADLPGFHFISVVNPHAWTIHTDWFTVHWYIHEYYNMCDAHCASLYLSGLKWNCSRPTTTWLIMLLFGPQSLTWLSVGAELVEWGMDSVSICAPGPDLRGEVTDLASLSVVEDYYCITRSPFEIH